MHEASRNLATLSGAVILAREVDGRFDWPAPAKQGAEIRKWCAIQNKTANFYVIETVM